MNNSNRKNFFILSFALIVVMLGFGMVIPVFPFYIENLGAGGSELGMLVALSALLEFVFGPIWGAISDRIGRKPVLSIGMFGYALSTFLFGISTELWMLFAARAISGLLSSATITAAMAYVSDSTSEEDRGGGMGKIGAAMAFGMIFGPGVGGWLAGDILALPFFLASASAVLSLILILFLLPESKPPGQLEKSEFKPQIEVKKLIAAMNSQVGVLLFMIALFSFALSNFEAVFGLYALEKFGYAPESVGIIFMVVAVVSTIGKATLTGPTTKRWGEAAVIKVSLISGSVGYLILLAANTFFSILLATAFFILSKTLLRPASFSLISKQNSANQGSKMGLSNSFMSLGRIVGPLWAGFIFDVNIDYPYLSGSIFMLIGFLISLVWVKRIKETD